MLGPIAVLCAVAGINRLIFLPVLMAGTLSDIFDGILARRFGVSTPALRRYDSITDVIYYLFVLMAVWILCKPVVEQNIPAITLILLSEAAGVLVCFVRFRKYPATHSYLAKFYGLCLLAGLIALLAFNASGWVILALTAVALVTNGEIVAIHLLANSPPVDVRSIFVLPVENKKTAQKI